MAQTSRQKEIVAEFINNRLSIAENLIQKAIEAKEAIVKLPHTNEDGSKVVHRDNLEMIMLFYMYVDKYQAISKHLTDEEVDHIYNKYPKWRDLDLVVK